MNQQPRQIAMGAPRLFEDMRLAGSDPQRIGEVAAVGTAYDSVLCADFTYVSTPITSGEALYRAMDRAGVADPDAFRRDRARFSSEVLLPNIAAADAVARTMLGFGGAVIAPAAFEARALGWGQDEYMGLWLDTIERKATRIAMVDGWAYSNGGAEEYLQAILMQAGRRDRSDIDVVDARGARIAHLDAIELIASAVSDLSSRGFRPRTLATVLHRLVAIHGMVADETRYGVMTDTSGRRSFVYSPHYVAASPTASEHAASVALLRRARDLSNPLVDEAERDNRSSAVMAPGLVRRAGRDALESVPAMLHRPDEGVDEIPN
jgi:hypothetical protein